MQYRELGRTGLRVSRLGFGAMRLPMLGTGDKAVVDREKAIPLIRQAFAAGVNYIDTAVMYCNYDSQTVLGEALQGWRDKVIVSTKNPYLGDDEKQWWQNLETSLRRLQTDHIDVYHHHGVNWNSFREHVLPRVGHWMRKARDQGLVKHVACSFHDHNAALRNILACDYAEVITVQYNLLDRQLADAMALAASQGVGVVVMGPVGGGRLAVDTGVFGNVLGNLRRIPELALRFVLANPHVTVALSGMSDLQMLAENAAICSDAVALSVADQHAIDEHLRKLQAMADLYCTGCGYCKPCPQKVDIPAVFGRYNQARVYGFWEHARASYRWLTKGGLAADHCIECGACEAKCPQKIEIRRQLKEAHQALA